MDIYASALSPALDIGTGCYILVVGMRLEGEGAIMSGVIFLLFSAAKLMLKAFISTLLQWTRTKTAFSTAVLSITGNLLVIITAVKKSSKMKPPELLCVNLAVTDLGAAVTMYPLSVASAWSHRWIGGDATCVYYGLVGFLFGVASIMNLTILAIVRFTISLNLQSPKEKITWKSVKIMCVWIWLYSVMWAMFPVLGWGRYGPEPFGISCSLAWGQMKDGGFSFVVAIFSLNLAVPAVVIICCYFGIAIKLYFTYKKTINTNQIPMVIKLHRRLLIIAVLISVGFLGCWAPYGLVSLWSILKDSSSIPPEVSLLPCMFAKSSTVYNPLIYYIFSQSFKMEVQQLFLGCLSFKFCRTSSSNNSNETPIYMVSTGKPPTSAQTIQETSHASIMN